MPYVGDPPGDAMVDRIEEKIRDLLVASPDLDAIKVFYRGETAWVPVTLSPFAITYLTTEQEAVGQEGYGEETGYRYYRYDGYASFEVIIRDVEGMVPDENRRADIPSYIESKKLTQAAFNAIMQWGGPTGELDDNPVLSYDGKERTVELRTDTITNGLQRRGDNVSNRGTVEFHVYTRRQDF